MKITKEWLKKRNACESSFNHVKANGYIGLNGVDFIKKLIDNNRLSDASWLIVRVMTKRRCVQYAIFAAEQVIDIFEKKYPGDARPRKAIEAAQMYLKNPCLKTKRSASAADAAYAAAYAAADAAYAADAVHAAAYAADAVHAAAYAADAAVYAVHTAAYAEDAAVYAAYAVHAAAYASELKIKILTFGISLMGE